MTIIWCKVTIKIEIDDYIGASGDYSLRSDYYQQLNDDYPASID